MVQETHTNNKGIHKFTSSDGKIIYKCNSIKAKKSINDIGIIVEKNTIISLRPISERICDALRDLLLLRIVFYYNFKNVKTSMEECYFY